MNKNLLRVIAVLPALAYASLCDAQISKNENKFLGNITTYYQVDYGNEKYYTLWNQITPENESKWSSIEGTRGGYNWGSDASYNYAKNHKFPFKFHCLVWGSQYPDWIVSLTPEQRYKAVVDWMDAVKKHYPNLQLIDVVNEAVPGHQQGTYLFEEALGGAGKTGYDWIIKAFELASERWPDAILIYNDFNTFRWQKTEYINLVRTLRDAGAPIDAYGCQSHDLTDMEASDFKSAMDEIHKALMMPMYISEYDIGTADDAYQLKRYKEQIPYMWEADYCAGITLWGYIYGATWTTDGNSGLIRNGKDRPAMEWLRDYMKDSVAVNAKSPFPGMVKEASVYVKPKSIYTTVNEPTTITVNARLRTKTIDKIEFYVNNALYATLTEAPYVVDYTPTKTGVVNLKAIVYATDGSKYERLSRVTVTKPRSPFKGNPTPIPGTVKAADYDKGDEGVTYHDSNASSEGDYGSYRSEKGIDIVRGNGGAVVGYTNSGEWMEYTVNVEQSGYYTYSAVASSGTTGSGFSISVSDEGKLTKTATINVPQTANNDWSKFTTITGRTAVPLEAGLQVLRITVEGSSCNIDKVTLTHVEVNHDVKLKLTASKSSPVQGDPVTISAAITKPEGVTVKSVNFYLDDKKMLSDTSEPYSYECKTGNLSIGKHTVKAVAIMDDDSESEFYQTAFNLLRKRAPYRTVSIPGTIEFENFDVGGEGRSFHDSDSQDEGKAGYRNDNEGLDITSGNKGYCIGYTINGEWMEYTVNVKQGGTYAYEATVSSGTSGTSFSISYKNSTGGYTTLASVNVGQVKANDWETYAVRKGQFRVELPEGQQILRVTITGSYCNLDKMKLTLVAPTDIDDVPESSAGRYEVYSLTGACAGNISVSSESEISSAIYQLTGKNGLFIIKNIETGWAERYMSGL